MHLQAFLLLLLLLLLFFSILPTIEGILYTQPPRGWNSWFAYDVSVNETNLKSNADALVSTGLAAMNFSFLNIDGGWQGGRYTNGTVYANTTRFPHGLEAVVSYVTSLGLSFGAYTDRAQGTCDGHTGSAGHEVEDAQYYSSLPAAFVKSDSCGGNMSHLGALEQYAILQSAINATGVQIFYSLCGWLKWYPIAPLVLPLNVGQSWRIGPDALGWDNVLMNIDAAADAAGFVGPGRFADVDEIMGPSRNRPISVSQTRTQFSLITIIGSPLLLSFDLTNKTAEDPDVAPFLNPEMLAIHWDPHPQGPVYKKLRGGYVSTDKLSPYTQVTCNTSDPTQQWNFLPTVNTSTGYLMSVGAPGWCLNAGPAWAFSTNNAQQIWISKCGAVCGDEYCNNQQFSFNPDGTITSMYMGKNAIAAGPYLTVDVIPNSLFMQERLSGPAGSVFNDSTAQLWSYDNHTLLLHNYQNNSDRCVAGAPRDTANVWYKALDDGGIALLLINFGPVAQTVSCDASCFADAGFSIESQVFSIRDVWTRSDNGTTTAGAGYSAVDLAPGGASVIVKLSPQ